MIWKFIPFPVLLSRAPAQSASRESTFNPLETDERTFSLKVHNCVNGHLSSPVRKFVSTQRTIARIYLLSYSEQRRNEVPLFQCHYCDFRISLE